MIVIPVLSTKRAGDADDIDIEAGDGGADASMSAMQRDGEDEPAHHGLYSCCG